ncbi:hypothetical protein E4U43_003212 [Claviceps pusilla]|uniref:FAD-binding domain-containing protein n=1 Tax=Claviceps pusilla TaxID=123648 RepID=A0A9P7SXV9_9HYPO|nr:hypothetical protein E4U43_003212 [Claviceps pusilla]
MEVIIVGSGISGVTLAITLSRYRNVKVTIFEKTTELRNVGNGLQIPCNSSHTMRCLGLLDKLRALAKQAATSFRSLTYDGKVVLDRNLRVYEELYGAPWLLLHRADYLHMLLDEARRLGVVLKSGCQVTDVDFSAPSVTLENGEVYNADLIVGADGIHSRIRSVMHPSIRAVPTGEYAYRGLFEQWKFSSNPSLQHLVSSPDVVRLWRGPRANAVLYPLQGGKLFNFVIPISDTAFNEACTKSDKSLLDSVKERLRDWDPLLLEVLGQADQLIRFPLYQVPELPSWSRGSVALIGDAAHAMLPHLAQGAATAVEDGFVLGTLLGRWAQDHLSARPEDNTPAVRRRKIQTLLRSYENIQRERITRIASCSRWTGTLEHLPSGPDQRARDAEFAAFDPYHPESCVSGLPWIDGRWNRELLGRKADQVTEREFKRVVDGWKLEAEQQVRGDGYGRARL